MVEYAILLILLVTLFVGGTELGLTALASNKNTEAAKSGISEYAEINQQRLNILNAEKQYLDNLSGYGCSVFYQIKNDYETIDDESGYTKVVPATPPATEPMTEFVKVNGVNVTRETLNADDFDYSCQRLTDAQINSGITKEDLKDNFVELLDEIYNDSVLMNDVYTKDGLYYSIYRLAENLSTSTGNSPSELIKSIYVDENQDGIITEIELMNGESAILNSTINDVTASDRAAEGQLKYKALLLISHYKLSLLPLDTETTSRLSEARISIGEHDNSQFSMPKCTDSGYSDGLPVDRYIGHEYFDSGNIKHFYTSGNKVYLFHPLAVDVSNCTGVDADRDNKPRLRILIDGYTPTAAKLAQTGKSFDELFVPGMPKLNQAMYSNYEQVCLDANNAYVSCSSQDVAQRLLKPPGKLCLSTTDTPGIDRCIDNVNPVGVSGFYFFANANDAATGSFEYTQNDADRNGNGKPDFNPAMQVECGPTPDKNIESIFDNGCLANASKVRIHTRYRRVFEGFLTFGLLSLTDMDLLPYFFNPSLVGEANHVVVGAHGSEVGPLGRNGNPSIKHFMDFRGCYEVDVATNQVSACN